MREGRSRVRARSATIARHAGRTALALLGASLLTWACTSTVGKSGSPLPPASRLASSSAGVCGAIAALPDVATAQRAFINLAHDALHELAGDPRLDRLTSGRVLEAMETVEADFSRSAGGPSLADDLTGLQAATDGALRELGVAPPPCPP